MHTRRILLPTIASVLLAGCGSPLQQVPLGGDRDPERTLLEPLAPPARRPRPPTAGSPIPGPAFPDRSAIADHTPRVTAAISALPDAMQVTMRDIWHNLLPG
jgi:hypothetical protein